MRNLTSKQSKKITIISRNSQLAMVQANFVKNKLEQLYPLLSVDILGITTQGDKILDVSLEKIGGKGLFIKELEKALLDSKADIAVHSLKDLPANLPDGFSLAAILERENPFDAFVSNKYSHISELPEGAIIGTSSARRRVILQNYYPHLKIELLRGNLQTRLMKLDRGDFAAIVLAVAGLKRLGLDARIKHILDTEQFIPAIGQGALGIEILSSRTDLFSLLAPLSDTTTFDCVSSERAFGKSLNASCNIPIAAYAKIEDNTLKLNTFFADPETGEMLFARASGNISEAVAIGEKCAVDILSQKNA